MWQTPVSTSNHLILINQISSKPYFLYSPLIVKRCLMKLLAAVRGEVIDEGEICV
jgi:hypothetical protein